MPMLNNGNSSVDKSSGAVMFHKSPELLEIMRLRDDVKRLDEKMDEKMDAILEILRGGERDGTKVGK